jgi:hypothetical protein
MPQRGGLAPARPSYQWVFDLLFGGAPAVTWAAAGELPAGYETVERYAVLPAGADRSFAVSLASRPGACSALTAYNALRPPRRRLARSVVGWGLRSGITQPLLRRQVEIGMMAGATGRQRADELLSEHLRELFGRPVVMAFGCGGGPYRKPVLQVFAAAGSALGYIKVGWNDWTRDAVRREAAALTACAAHPMRLGVPALLSQSTWRGLDLLVTAPLPPRITRITAGEQPDTAALSEISRLSTVSAGELSAGQWWSGLRSRIETRVTDRDARGRLRLLADGIERVHGRTTLQFGSWHGDFVPWNLARLGERLYAWDWESSAPQAPVGFDALHFHFQVAFVARRCPLEEAAALAARMSSQALDALGIAADRHGLLATLHLLELAVRHEEAHSSAGDSDARFFPAVLQLLERALAHPPDSASLHSAASTS